MKVAWISANIFGYEVFGKCQRPKGVDFRIITLGPKSPIKMYDAIQHPRSWDRLGAEVVRVERLEKKHLKGCDLAIVAGWREYIRHDIRDACPLGMVGFHPTLLPYGRGPAPIINTILHGVKESGVTLFFLDEGLDSGDIIDQEAFKVEDWYTSMEVYNESTASGIKIIRRQFRKLLKGESPRRKQDESKAFVFTHPDEKNHPKEVVARAFDWPYR